MLKSNNIMTISSGCVEKYRILWYNILSVGVGPAKATVWKGFHAFFIASRLSWKNGYDSASGGLGRNGQMYKDFFGERFMVVLSCVDSEPSLWKNFEGILGIIGNIQTLHSIFAVIILIALFWLSVVSFTRRVNTKSLKQIDVFKKSRKYIPDLFTELNENLENLRYFVFSNRWKRRIIHEYNRQFSNAQGKEIARILSNDLSTKKLSCMTSIDDLMDAIIERKKVIEQLKEDKEHNRRKYGEKFFYIREYIYFIPAKLSTLYMRCELLKTKNLIVIGSAGNGKTNLLCNLVEIIINNKVPCLFINSKDVDCGCFEYVVKKILPRKLFQTKKIFLTVVSWLLFLSNKYFFVVIDAINENDSDAFASSIGKMVDELSKYKRIKVICSCRSEYFDARYKKYFVKCAADPYVLALNQVEYDDRAKEKMMVLYQEYYDVRVLLSGNVRDRLMHSLLLMRLFFEVNTGRNTDNLELCDAEIYKAYFEKVARDAEPFDFQSKVNNLAKLMVERKNFKEIQLDDLGLSTEDQARLKNVLDDNLVISRKIQAGTGITERTVEYVYFVFDELRDFCIARYLLTTGEEKQDGTYSGFFAFIAELNEQCLSPLEGILKYAYYYFKKIHRNDLCQALLDSFSEYNPQHKQNWWDRQEVFSNFGLSLVFQAASDLLDFELEYIVKCVSTVPSAFWDVYRFLLRNEYAGVKPNTKLLTTLILEKIPYADMREIVESFFADQDKEYFYRNSPRRIDNLCDAIDKLAKHMGGLPIYMKTFLVVLAALEPQEVALYEYEDYVEEVLATPEFATCNAELQKEIMKLKEHRDSISEFDSAWIFAD